MPWSRTMTRRLGILALATTGAAAGAVYFSSELAQVWTWATTDQSPPAVFAGALILLPALGFPLSPLLVLLGGRFGWVTGLAILAAVVPLHLAAAFWISRKLLYEKFMDLARKRGVDLSAMPLSGRIKAGIFFMAVPALSYSLKNHLLPLSGLPAPHIFWIGWSIQVLLGVPFVVFGAAASDWSLPLMAGAVLLAVLFLATSGPAVRAYKRLIRKPESTDKENTQ